jgi:regulator of protease activity HflC (stomatin/prohibitin superfamily)
MIRFTCPNTLCGKSLKAPPEAAGHLVRCSGCGTQITVTHNSGGERPNALPMGTNSSVTNRPPALPSHSPSRHESTYPSDPSDEEADDDRPLWRDPVQLALMTSISAGLFTLVAAFLIGAAFYRQTVSVPLLSLGLIALLLAMTSGLLALQLFAAKQRAIAGRPVRLLFGLARLITWEQNEGLLLLRDKKVVERIYGPRSGGGLRLLYPFLGEEVRERVPLSIQLTWYEDSRVLTREAVQLSVKVALYWQVRDLEAYSYKIDSEVRSLRDGSRTGAGSVVIAMPVRSGRSRLDVANVWMRTLAESSLRKLVSQTSTLQIVSKRAAMSLPEEVVQNAPVGTDDATPATPDVIADRLKAELHPRVSEYGLGIDRVEIQEVQLPPAFQKAVDDVWVAATQPRKSRYEAESMEAKLSVVCRLLGKEAAAMGEIVQKLPSGSYLGNPLASLQAMITQLAAAPAAALPVATPLASPTKPSQEPPSA